MSLNLDEIPKEELQKKQKLFSWKINHEQNYRKGQVNLDGFLPIDMSSSQ